MFLKITSFFFTLLLANLISAQVYFQAKDEKMKCDPDIALLSGKKIVIKDFKEEEFSVWCNPGDDFDGIGLHYMGSERINRYLNLTREELGINNQSLWYHIHVKTGFDYHMQVLYKWKLYVSVEGILKVNGTVIDWGYINEFLQSINLTAYGASKWRFEKPDDNCTVEIYRANNTIVNNVPTCKDRSETSIAQIIGVTLLCIMMIFDIARELSYWFPNSFGGFCIFPHSEKDEARPSRVLVL